MLKNYHDSDYPERNRDKKKKPKSGFGYCACDRTLMPDWAKCPICGARNGRKRYKV